MNKEIPAAGIAVIGMACRFPGAKTVETFWQNLQHGVESISFFSDNELLEAGIHADILKNPHYVKAGGILEDVESFDAGFFDIPASEAKMMDPQHRLLLECAWEALEHSGYAPGSYQGAVGVYAGSRISEYLLFNQQAPDLTGLASGSSISGFQRLIANDKDYLTTRIAYKLNLRGPAVTVQTACSTSLVAVHLACESLLNGECDMALAGGVSVRVPQKTGYLHHEGMIFSPDGHTRAFDANAGGTLFSSGAGMVALKRLDEALADRDCIHAVIRGTAVNNDGSMSKAGYTAPSEEGQARVIAEALAVAEVEPETFGYIETHGTGTALGDSIEMSALNQVFQTGGQERQTCAIGSVKSNIGHLVQAAGIAGFIKTVLMLKHQMLIPSLHFETPNPHLDFSNSPFYVNTVLAEWKVEEGPRRAGVSSFGFGGTNAHVVLEEAPDSEPVSLAAERPLHLLTLSAGNEAGLRELAERYTAYLHADAPGSAADICFTSHVGRSHFRSHRLAAIAESSHEFARKLSFFTAEKTSTDLLTGQTADTAKQPKIAFLFSDRGSQYTGMGRQLYETSPTFRDIIQTCDRLLRPELSLSIISILYPEPGTHSLTGRSEFSQPALFALEYALAELWRSWGIAPTVVTGQGVGEYAAACFAGIFCLEDGLKLIVERHRLLQQLSRAGETETETLLDAFEQMVSGLTPSSPKLPFATSISGKPAGDVFCPDAKYWRRQLVETRHPFTRKTVLQRLGCQIALEIGPDPVVSNSRDDDAGTLWLSPLAPGRKSDWQGMLENLAALYVRGITIDWEGFERDYASGRQRLALPTYPFQRRRYWIEPATNAGQHSTCPDRKSHIHPLLGSRLRSPLQDIQFESQPRLDSPSFLRDHCIYDTPLFPATAFIEMIAAATKDVFAAEQHAVTIEEMVMQQALPLSEHENHAIQIIMSPETADSAAFRIFSAKEKDNGEDLSWTLHVRGKARFRSPKAPQSSRGLKELQAQCREHVPVERFYERKRERGLNHGTAFQGVQQLRRGAGAAIGRIRLPELPDAQTTLYHVPPVFLDACIQIGEAAFPDYAQHTFGETLYLPMIWELVNIYDRFPAQGWSYASIQKSHDEHQEIRSVDFRIFDDSGRLLADIQGLHFKHFRREHLRQHVLRDDIERCLYHVEWQPTRLPLTRPAAQQLHCRERWIIFTQPNDAVGIDVMQRLEKQGAACIPVFPGKLYEKRQEGGFTIDPASSKDMQRLFQEIAEAKTGPCRGMLFLWAITASSLQTDRDLICRSVLYLIQSLTGSNIFKRLGIPQLWLATQGAQSTGTETGPLAIVHSLLWGLGRAIMREHPELHCRLIDLDPAGDVQPGIDLFAELSSKDKEAQIAWRDKIRYAARLVSQAQQMAHEKEDALAVPKETSYLLDTDCPGLLENLRFQASNRRPPVPGEVEIQVHATGLNFRDILNALGRLPGRFGFECSGTIAACGAGVTGLSIGDAVIAVAPESFRRFVTVDARVVVPKPSHLSFEEAASIPLAFLTAYYGLVHLAKMTPADKVLIHSAAGGVGLAAIQLAQWTGAEIFATAHHRKWNYLKSLGVQHVMDSRSLDFSADIMSRTRGKGVDIVLNSLAGEFVPKSVSLLKEGGRFIELGQTDVWNAGQIAEVRPDVSFFEFRLVAQLSQQEPDFFQAMFRDVMQSFGEGKLRPLPRRVFPLQQVVDAFRTMAQAKHIGKIVISHKACLPESLQQSPLNVNHRSTYLITGGLGGLGLHMARWLADRGARHLVLLGRRPPSVQVQRMLDTLEQKQIHIMVVQADVTRKNELSRVLADIDRTMPPLRGIIHAAGVLHDGTLQQQTWEQFAAVLEPKTIGAWNLHSLTRHLPLDFFLLFSSMASLLGNPGQSNYSAANAFLDALAHERNRQGLPATSINWGAWSDIGMAAGLNDAVEQRRTTLGMHKIKVEQGEQFLQRILQEHWTQIGVTLTDWSKYVRQFPDNAVPPLLSKLAERGQGEKASEPQPAKAADFAQLLNQAPPEQRHELLAAHIRERVAEVLGYEVSSSDMQRSLLDIGLDSLMALELRNQLMNDMGGMELSIATFLDGSNILRIAERLLEQFASHAPEPLSVREKFAERPQADSACDDWEEGEI